MPLTSCPLTVPATAVSSPYRLCQEKAQIHILEDEAASRAYLNQVWAEAMEIYKSGRWKLIFSTEMVHHLKEHQRDFMPEDTKAGIIQDFLDSCPGDTICSRQLYKEALNHAFDEPKQWEIREIKEIMNRCVTGWKYFSNPRMFAGYGRQKGWEREQAPTGLEKPRRDLRRCRSRWSFHSEKIRQMTARCTLRCYPAAEPVAGENPVTIGFFPL